MHRGRTINNFQLDFAGREELCCFSDFAAIVCILTCLLGRTINNFQLDFAGREELCCFSDFAAIVCILTCLLVTL